MMNENQFLIHPLKESDIFELAKIHCVIFSNSRSTGLGILYVKKMFEWFFNHQSKLCFVAINDGKIVGYVVGAIGGYGRKLFRFAIWEIIIGLLTHPRLWLKKETYSLWPSYLKGLLPTKKPENIYSTKSSSAALAGIGVIPSMQGKQIGKALTLNFEKAAREQHVEKLTLSVHSENMNARKMYELCGWTLDSIVDSRKSAHYSKKIT